MPVATIPAVTLPSVKTQSVAWKQRWNGSWETDSRLWCESAHWTVQPSLPVAHLVFRYGVKLAPGETDFLARSHPGVNGSRLQYFVRITYQTQDDPLVWYGVIDIDIDDVHAAINRGGGNRYDSGRLHFVAYGLERLLDDAMVTTTYCSNGNGGAYRVNRPLAFNGRGEPNRAEVGDPDGLKLFLGKPGEQGRFWNTRDAVRHLLRYHGPKGSNGDAVIPFQLDDSALLPNWDQPTIETHGASVRQILNALIPRQRLLGWRCQIESESESGPVIVRPFTWLGEDLTIEGVNGGTIRANPVKISIQANADRTCTYAVKHAVTDRVDQVVCTGAQCTSTGNFCYGQGSLGAGWSEAQEAEYWTGGSDQPGFPPETKLHEQMAWVFQHRLRDALASVFQRYVLPASWGGLVGDGVGSSASSPLMPDGSGGPSRLCAEDWRFLAELPFRQNLVYRPSPKFPNASLDRPLPAAEGKQDFLKLMVLVPRSDSTDQSRRYRHAEGISDIAQLPARVDREEAVAFRSEVRRDDPAVWIHSSAGVAHVIASQEAATKGKFPIDEPQVPLNWRQLIVVATVPWSEFVSGAYPPTPLETDAVRVLTIDLGPAFRRDYVATDTIVGLKENGELDRVYAAGHIRDDRQLLRGLARAAYEFYYPVRAALNFETSYLTAQIPLASYATTIGDQTAANLITRTLNTVVTSLAVSSPLVESDTATESHPPRLTIETAHGELDLLKLLGGVNPGPAHPRRSSPSRKL